MRLGIPNVGVDYAEAMSGTAVGINRYNATVKKSNTLLQYRSSELARFRVNLRRTAEGVRRISRDMYQLGIINKQTYNNIVKVTSLFTLVAYSLMAYQALVSVLMWALWRERLLAAKDTAFLVAHVTPLVAAGIVATALLVAEGVREIFDKESHDLGTTTYTIADSRDLKRSMEEARYYATEYE